VAPGASINLMRVFVHPARSAEGTGIPRRRSAEMGALEICVRLVPPCADKGGARRPPRQSLWSERSQWWRKSVISVLSIASNWPRLLSWS